nr:reverse transcriptase domain-containing protein [Tanacetum cinerariifolium]
MTAHHNDWDTSAQWSESSSSITSSFDTKIAALKAEKAKINKNLMRVLQVNEQVKAVTHNCETYGGPHSFSDCPTIVGNTQNVYAARAYQGNTITNPNEDLKGITTRSETTYQGPTISTTSSSLPPVVEHETEATKDMPVASPVSALKPNQRPLIPYPSILHDQNLLSAPKPNQRLLIPYPSRLHNQKLRDKANDQREKFFQIFKELNFNISFADALILMPKFGPTIKTLLTNKDKLSKLVRSLLNEHCSEVLLKKLPEKLGDPDKFLIPCNFPGMAECLALADLSASINLMPLFVWNKLSLPDLSPMCMTLEIADRLISHPVGVAEDVLVKEYSQEVLGFSDVITSGNPTPYYDPIVSITSPTQTPFENSDFLLEKVDIFLASLPPQNQGNYLPQVRKELKICEAKSDKSSIDKPLEVELKDLPPYLEYAILEGDDKLPVIIVKDLSVEEKTTLITVLKSHKRAIAWKLFDIKDEYRFILGVRNSPKYIVTNPKEDLKRITTRSGNAYQGPTIPTTSSSLPKVIECETKVIKDTVPPTNNESTKDIQPLVVQVETLVPNSEPVAAPAVLLKKLPENLGDPDKFLILCDFLEMDECLALADLGASINLMPLSVWNKISLPELTLTLMTLKLADRSISRPIGVAEDVFVKVGKFHFPADFIVVDFDADPRVPLILGRSFLKTRRALIDVYAGELTL